MFRFYTWALGKFQVLPQNFLMISKQTLSSESQLSHDDFARIRKRIVGLKTYVASAAIQFTKGDEFEETVEKINQQKALPSSSRPTATGKGDTL